jgi:hypothetical protein
VGYSGTKARKIAKAMIPCLEANGFRAAVPIPGRPEFESVLESENKIMERALLCQASVLICNRRTYSDKFLDEVQFLAYETSNPLIPLVQKRSHVPPVLKVRRRVEFQKGHHLRSCRDLIDVLKAKIGGVHFAREGDELGRGLA